MRTQYISGISVSYPEEVVAAYDKSPIWIEGFTGTAIQMTVTNNSTNKSVEEKRSPFDGECFFDLAYYLQVLLKPTFMVSYSSVSDSGMASRFTVNLQFLDGTATIGNMSFDVIATWASVISQKDEQLRMFDGYPFTVGVFTDGTYSINAGGAIYKPTAGIHNFPVTDNTSVVVSDSEGNVVQTIKVTKSCGEGIYLRWVDKCGVYRYWMFRKGNVTNSIKASEEFLRKNTGTDNSLRKSTKSVGTKIEICAPLVDENAFDFLMGVAASTMVDMYNNGEWLSVDVEQGDIVREMVMLQDFVVTLVLPVTEVQKL